MLPLVKAIVSDIMELSTRIMQTHERLRAMRNRVGESQSAKYNDEVVEIEAGLNRDCERLDEYVSELRELGVEPKGLADGLVDFPAMLDGNVVNLCWRFGEEKIEFWHTLDGGFSGRQDIDPGQFDN